MILDDGDDDEGTQGCDGDEDIIAECSAGGVEICADEKIEVDGDEGVERSDDDNDGIIFSKSFEKEQIKPVDRGPPRLIKKSVKRKLLDEEKDFIEVGSDSEEDVS